MNANYPTPFLVGTTYYFKYTDRTGIRRKRTTGCKRKCDAQKFVHIFIDRLRSGVDTHSTLRNMLRLYQNSDTNPKRQQAVTTQANYTDRYAIHTARHAKDLEAVLEKGMRKMIDKPLCQIIRLDIKEAVFAIVKAHGSCNKSAKLYKLLKIVFSQATEDGLIPVNPVQGLPDIRYATKSRKALPASDIQLVLNHPEIFPNPTARRLFTILATTGLRRSELLAMGPDQLRDDVA